ncbi:MAG TPA: DUF3343 domain-containing protein [Clostridiales bacterium]|nr:DUF3343 domain-containing protein [Clostridiales bacterium]HQP69621.1 DUF3343 domain-containing protein [Clostridiales bacterium]
MLNKGIILFHSSNYAMWADNVLKKKNIDHRLIPVPRELSSDCGYCIEFENNSAAEVTKLLKNENIEFDRIETI